MYETGSATIKDLRGQQRTEEEIKVDQRNDVRTAGENK